MKNVYQLSLRAVSAPGGGDPGDEGDDESDNHSHHYPHRGNKDPC